MAKIQIIPSGKIFELFKMDIFSHFKVCHNKEKWLLEDVLQNGFLGIKAGEIELLKWNPTPPISIDMLRGICVIKLY